MQFLLITHYNTYIVVNSLKTSSDFTGAIFMLDYQKLCCFTLH